VEEVGKLSCPAQVACLYGGKWFLETQEIKLQCSSEALLQHPVLNCFSSLAIMSINVTNTTSIPAWIPSGFQVNSGNRDCPSPTTILTQFALYNGIAIAIYLLTGSAVVKAKLTCRRDSALKPWRFWSALGSVVTQLLGTIVTSLMIRAGGYKVDLWQLIQIWAIRPRVSWFIGNMTNIRRKWGYMNGALDNVVVEVFVCSIGCVFVGRTAQAALTHMPSNPPAWYWVITIASIVMLITTAFEIVWALWTLKRTWETKGRAEAQDMDSMKWIVRALVPTTCLCSWLIWAAFLNSSSGAYCPATKNAFVLDIVWTVVPVLTNIMRAVLEAVYPY